jgi:hypothetical protein
VNWTSAVEDAKARQECDGQRKDNDQLTDERIHGFGRAANNHSDDDERRANKSNIATANKIGKRANEWTDTG